MGPKGFSDDDFDAETERLGKEEIEKQAKEQFITELVAIERALDEFLSGEIKEGLISPFKLTLIVQSRAFLALVKQTKQDVPENTIRVTD